MEDNRMIKMYFVHTMKRYCLFAVKCWRFLKNSFNRG